MILEIAGVYQPGVKIDTSNKERTVKIVIENIKTNTQEDYEIKAIEEGEVINGDTDN